MYAINLGIKLLFFTVFLAVLYLVIDYFVLIVKTEIDLPFLDLFYYLGVIQAIQILISMAITSYVVNQTISFFKG